MMRCHPRRLLAGYYAAAAGGNQPEFVFADDGTTVLAPAPGTVVMGAGVSGLQALALPAPGPMVEGYDVRPWFKEQVESVRRQVC